MRMGLLHYTIILFVYNSRTSGERDLPPFQQLIMVNVFYFVLNHCLFSGITKVPLFP